MLEHGLLGIWGIPKLRDQIGAGSEQSAFLSQQAGSHINGEMCTTEPAERLVQTGGVGLAHTWRTFPSSYTGLWALQS